MKAKLLIIALFALNQLIPSISFGQKHFCGSHEIIQSIENKSPGFKSNFLSLTDEFKANKGNRTTLPNCTVNVVVHVVYFSASSNLSTALINRQIEILENCFNRKNADTVDMRPDFNIVTGLGTNIHFQLATLDPNGQPTNGIIRTQTTIDGFGSFFDIAESVKSASTGGSSPWDTDKYLNIWVCDTKEPSGQPLVAGYATPPGGLPNWPSMPPMIDGIVIQTEFFGENNPLQTSGENDGKVLVHEAGHYFGLRHIWGDESFCTGDDGIDDTPQFTDPSYFDCDLFKNTCVDNIQNIDLPDMIENYMDYSLSTCQNSFTNNQAEFMNWVYQNKRAGLGSGPNVSIKTIENDFKVELFPNPANNFAQIKSDTKLSNYILFNSLGQIVSENQVSGNQFSIDLNSLESGFYFLKLANEKQTKTIKLVKSSN